MNSYLTRAFILPLNVTPASAISTQGGAFAGRRADLLRDMARPVSSAMTGS